MSVLKDSLAAFTEGARVNFDTYGYLLPVFAGVIDGKTKILGISLESVSHKEAFAHQIQNLIADDRLREYIMVVECWVVDTQKNEQSKVREWLKVHGSLENYPDRREVIMVSYSSPTEEIQYTAGIIRGRIPLIEEWNVNHRNVKFNHDDFTARFQSLFLKSKAGQN